MKAIFVGDVHYSGSNPVGRLDSYSTAILLKLTEIGLIAHKNNIKNVIFTGDMFHTPVISLSDFVRFQEVFKTAFKGLNCYIVPGNHDIFGYNITTLRRTSLYLLSLCIDNFFIFSDTKPLFLDNIILTSQHYCNELDVDGFGYDPDLEGVDIQDRKIIHVVHGMLLPNKPPFEKYTLIKDVKSKADIIVTGHYHPGWMSTEYNGTYFINNGSICRRDASSKEIDRIVVITIIDTDENAFTTVPLESAKPGKDVLSREHLELTDSEKNVEEFNELIQATRLNKKFVNIGDMITYIADKSELDKEIVDYAIAKVEFKLEELSKKDVK